MVLLTSMFLQSNRSERQKNIYRSVHHHERSNKDVTRDNDDGNLISNANLMLILVISEESLKEVMDKS